MKNKFLLIALVALIGLQFGCGEKSSNGTAMATASNGAQSSGEGTVLSGKLDGAANLKAYLDQNNFEAMMGIANTDIDANGNFKFNLKRGVKPGRYYLRVGARRLAMVFDGTEKNITVNGALFDLDKHKLPVTGSPASQELSSVMNAYYNGELKGQPLMDRIKSTENPYVALTLALAHVKTSSEENIAIHKGILGRLQAAKMKPSELNTYNNFIGQLEKQIALQRIAVGKPAPNIALPSPNGKNYSLDDLKGKVVLLDFWASWCGPCRRENPNVVKVYNQYKKQGFEVFSVSLDGLDERSRARFTTPEQVEAQMEQSKNRWKQAIEQDGLVWKNHVSDLKKWNSAPAQIYGVSGIPRTFMIDRDGKIAAIGLRGADAIETELKKLL